MRRILRGLVVRKECWTLSCLGRILLLLTFLGGALAIGRGLYPFLATTNQVGEILIVEGWIHASALTDVAKDSAAGRYQDVVVVNALAAGTNKWETGQYRAEYITNTLIGCGIQKERLHTVTCYAHRRDRTFYSAMAVKQWLSEHQMAGKPIDVVTIGPHARRSRVLFRKAFGSRAKVGVIALPERGYDPQHWWRSSEGVREVLFEGFAYLYAKLVFHPGPLPADVQHAPE